jgi:hypothetical protein
MKHQSEIPCAQSEPVDLQDEVISALLWRAGELLDSSSGAFGNRPTIRPEQGFLLTPVASQCVPEPTTLVRIIAGFAG